jgi:transposase
LDLQELSGFEDSSVVEIEVKAYRRVIHRKRFQRVCTCSDLKTIFAASVEPKLIAHGKYGVSVWTEVLLSKFSHGQPSHRLLQDLASHGLIMSAGTLAGGLQKIAPLFEPINKALLARLRSAQYWHADETRWATFVEVEGKVGHRWYLWVFHSTEVVHYVLDKTRAAHVIGAELIGVLMGIISCDRYSGYKKFARLHPGIELAFCWVHQRRDFLQLANSYPELSAWAFEWVDAIGGLYHLNDLRLQTVISSSERAVAQSVLDLALQRMADHCGATLLEPKLALPCVKVLTSMQTHWHGLTMFARCPWVSMDNNTAERDMRGPVIGRKNFFGSGALWSGQLACIVYSLLATLKLYGINERIWLGEFLQACANHGGQAPDDVSAFMPWSMNARQLAHMRGVSLAQSRAKVHGCAGAPVPEEVDSS